MAIREDAAAAQTPDLAVRDGDATDRLISGVERTDVAIGPKDSALPVRCPALGNGGVLNLGNINKALFSPDGKSLLVRIETTDSNPAAAAMWIEIASGQSRVLGKKVADVEWLGANAALVTSADQITAVSLDGTILRTVATPTCTHAATPDGSRIYSISGPCTTYSGPLSVLDLATGTSTPLASNISAGSLAVSPDSRWAAYVSGSPTATHGVLSVVDAAGVSRAVTEPATAAQPHFASNDVLLFQSQNTTGAAQPSHWRYDLRTQKSQRMGDGDAGLTGYEVAADGSAVLLAKYNGDASPGELFHISLANGQATRLASDVLDFRPFQMPIRAFAFAGPSNRVVYVADSPSDAYRFRKITSVTSDGKKSVQLTPGQPVMISPFADRVAIVSIDDAVGTGTITVTSAAGDKQFVVDVAGSVVLAAFVPRDRGLLFVEGQDFQKLRHLSFQTGAVVTLNTWMNTKLPVYRLPVGIGVQSYPVDPNGCVTVVSGDMDQTGSRLVAIPD